MGKPGFLAACAALVLTSPAHADVVSDWSELQTSIFFATLDPENNFDATRHQAISRFNLAMFEAANSVRPTYQSYLKLPPAAGGGRLRPPCPRPPATCF